METIVAIVSAAVAVIAALGAYAYRSDLKHLTEKHDALERRHEVLANRVDKHRHDHNNLELAVRLMEKK